MIGEGNKFQERRKFQRLVHLLLRASNSKADREKGKETEGKDRVSNSESRSMRPGNYLICGSRVREAVSRLPSVQLLEEGTRTNFPSAGVNVQVSVLRASNRPEQQQQRGRRAKRRKTEAK